MKHRRLIFVPTAAILLSCTTVSTELPDISDELVQSEKRQQVKIALTRQQDYLLRLATVAKPILTENAELCPRVRPYYGIITHSEKSYSKHILEDVQSEFGLTETDIVLHIIPNSPAEQAGLKAGDILLGEDGDPISAQALRKMDIGDDGRQNVTISREGNTQSLVIETVPACNYSLGLRSTNTVNAFATGRSIAVTTGMMDFVKTDEELAAIIGHELAHNTLGHIRKITTNYIFSGFATRYTRPFESESDYVGLYYAARAGYNIENVEEIWRRIGAQNARSIGRAKTHPTTPDRFLRLKAAFIEIENKRAAGEPLLPNFKDKTKSAS